MAKKKQNEVRALCARIGGQCATARALGVSDRTVRRWVSADHCPADHLHAMREIAREKQ